MTLRQLKIFITVCNELSITKAAKILSIAQPSVSLAIKEIENAYEVQLFDRIGKTIKLTHQGRQFFIQAKEALDQLEMAINQLQNQTMQHHFKAGFSMTIANIFLTDFIAQNQAYQGYLDIVVDNSKRLETQVIKGELDFAFVEAPSYGKQLAVDTIFNDEIIFICHPNHPFSYKEVDPDQLQTESIIMREKGSGVRQLFDATMLFHSIPYEVHFESISIEVIKQAVQKNIGISVMPRLLVKADIENHQLSTFKVKGIEMQRTVALIYPTAKQQTPFIMHFIEDFTQTIKKGLRLV